MFKGTLGFMSVLVAVTAARGQIVSNGNLDTVPPGTPPDCDQPLGGWRWPANYGVAGLCETFPWQFEVVPTSAFEPGAEGNSLHRFVNLEAGEPNVNIYLPNIFNVILQEDTDPLVIVTFDIWIPSGGGNGGNVFIGGDHGGGGWSFDTDRGPQMGWHSDGTVTVTPQSDGACPLTVLDPFPTDAWQTYRVEIDLETDRYDLWWAPRSDPMILIGPDLLFQHFAQLDHIDRFTVAHFPDGPAACFPIAVTTEAYFDNLAVTLCEADLDGNGTVDIVDFLQLLAAWGNCATPCLEDLNSNGAVGIQDFLQLLSEWGLCE